jgi:hypothetical protein
MIVNDDLYSDMTKKERIEQLEDKVQKLEDTIIPGGLIALLFFIVAAILVMNIFDIWDLKDQAHTHFNIEIPETHEFHIEKEGFENGRWT